MHLLASEAGSFEEGRAYDIQQSKGDIVILSHAASELTALAEAYKAFSGDMMARKIASFPSLRLMNLGFLGHPATIDAYCEQTLLGSKLVIVRLLGGQAYWQYGFDELRSLCQQHDIQLIFLAGDKNFDESLKHLSLTPKAESIAKIFVYFCAGGQENFISLLAFLSDMLGYQGFDVSPPLALADDGIWRQFGDGVGDKEAHAGKICVLFYRALIDGGDIAPIGALCDALDSQGIGGAAYYANNFRDEAITKRLKNYLQQLRPNLIIMATGFALAKAGKTGAINPHDDAPDIFENLDVPLLQIVLSSIDYQQWRDGLSGLPMREIAMNVALTELDGRLLTRMIACRDTLTIDPLTECPLARYHILPDRVSFIAALAKRYISLQSTPAKDKKLGFVLGNYPASDGRLANGVGLDTPQATLCLLQLAQADGVICNPPTNSDALMALLQAGPTNQNPQRSKSGAMLSLADYQHHFSKLPIEIQQAVNARWGEPAQDAFIQYEAFHLPIIILGNVAVGLQVSRGYELDPDATCHDPSLPPPHGYFAFYIWLRDIFGMHALTHIGKHGTLEWLPGKSLSLSAQCYPDAVLGAMPVIYPFICNDPGEGTQAKRRIQAVILDHLPPPLATGGLYDSLAELENLLDEYYDARQLDVRRRDYLAVEMVKMADALKLEIAIDDTAQMPEKLNAIENFLCDIKFTMIRAGLHRYGELPDDLPNFLLNLLRHKRGEEPHQQSLLQSLADELEFGFNPLEERDFTGMMALPSILTPYLETSTKASHKQVSRRLAVEALHQFALALITGDAILPETMPKTHAIISKELPHLRDLLAQSKSGETGAFIKAINGRYIAAGASGAPSRGRLDILPTGRNFYSVDMRDIPSKAAWQLGMQSADLLLKTH
nr:cobaltochelatase subunit CobN [Alphaproteobacteria bacterium]